MFGWMSIFSLMLLLSALFSSTMGMGAPVILLVRVVFGMLLFLAAMTFVLRRRA